MKKYYHMKSHIIIPTIILSALMAISCGKQETNPVMLETPVANISNSTETSFTVSWEAVENAAYYLYIFNSSTQGTTDENSIEFTGLTEGEKYTFIIKAVAEKESVYQDSKWSTLIEYTLQAEDPDNPDDNEDPDDPVVLDPEVGDYYFSDGTWSSKMESGKEVIGIVFWTGDPAKDDNALRNDHPECTHGLVVAIDGDQYVAWQSGYASYGKTVGEWVVNNTEYENIATYCESTDNLNKMLGYNNTKAIQAFNADPSNSAWPVEAVQAVDTYNETHPAPESSSGWYLPSIKEYIIMCYKETDAYFGVLPATSNYDMLNRILSSIPGAQTIGNDGLGFYSSSTEEKATIDKAYAISFCYATVATNTKDNATLYSTRFVLAF